MCSSPLKTYKSSFKKANAVWTEIIKGVISDFNVKQQLKFKFLHKYSLCKNFSCNVFSKQKLVFKRNNKNLLH